VNKYQKWREIYGEEHVRRLAAMGLCEEEIAARCGLELSLFRRWKKKYPSLARAIELGSQNADFAVVEALYKKATGYKVSLNKTYKLKRVDYDPDTGKKIREYEELATGVDEDHVPADIRAETFWLKNRQGDVWSDHPERSTDACDGERQGGVVEIPEADMIDDEE
jgi:hypothetical protein